MRKINGKVQVPNPHRPIRSLGSMYLTYDTEWVFDHMVGAIESAVFKPAVLNLLQPSLFTQDPYLARSIAEAPKGMKDNLRQVFRPLGDIVNPVYQAICEQTCQMMPR